jgi:GrpB-like predicted nucleotidyltransferase (UPF0157 family)
VSETDREPADGERSAGDDHDWTGPSADELARTAGERWQALVDSGEVVMFGEPSGEPVALVVSDAWPARFEELRRAIVSALGDTAVRVDHVGSTAVPGIPAKPVVDIQVSVPDVEDEEAYGPALERLGWPMRSREPGHRYFRTPKGVLPRIQIHVCQTGGEWERDHLLFRDYLRAHPERASAYGEIKRHFGDRYRDDRLAYTDAKTPFIRSTLALAERWAAETGWSVGGEPSSSVQGAR